MYYLLYLIYYLLSIIYIYFIGFEVNIVPFIKKYITTKNNIVNSRVPPANATANMIPRINNGIAIYCNINGKNVK